ncbi:hypothetical protein GEMRC1_013070 [Eukaryota sp. GEM-RC1]
MLSISTFAKEAIEQLQYLRSNNHLTDCVIEFEDLEFHCHFSIVVLFSKYLEKLDRQDHVEINSSGMVENPSIFEAIMLSMYGSPLNINGTNLFDIHVIAKLLKYTPLISHCTNLQLKGLQSSNKVFSLQGSTILEKLKRETPHDVLLKYKDYIARTNRLHLCCYSKYFDNLWTSQWADSNEQELSFDDMLKVSAESFPRFFEFLSGSGIKLTTENAFELTYLGSYFQVKSVVTAGNSFIEVNFDTGYIEQASSLNDLMFVKKHGQRLRSIKSTDFGINVTPEVFEILTSFNVDSVFLAKCLCNSWQNLKSDWTRSQFNSCLKSITCTSDTVNVISETLSDLLDDVDIEPLLNRFLLRMVPLQIQSSTATLAADVAKLRVELVGANMNFPDEVKNFNQQISNLETDNRFLREDIESLKSEVLQLKNIHLSKLKPELRQVLEEMRNGSVTELDLQENSIGNEGAIALAEALKVNSTVTQINLVVNSIGTEGAIALADALKVNSTVTRIDLGSNSIGTEGAIALAEALKVNSTVTRIDLGENSIGTKGAIALADALKVNSSVTEIGLRENSIGNEGAIALADALKVNCTVIRISLWENSIGNEGAIALADALKVNSTVTEINLGFNSIGTEGAIALADALKVNSTVTEINLGFNSIDSETKQLIKRISNNRIKC